jgi:hypothetical protein
MSKILANEIANFGDNAPIDLKEGLNIPAGKPIQAAGSAGSSGQVLSSTGTSIAWVAPFDGDYNSLSNRPTIPPAQVQSDWNATSGLGVVLNKPAVPPLPSVTTAAAGSAALTYNSGNGEFTFTPPDLSSYLTAETDTLDTVLGRGATTTRDITTTGKVYFSNNFADLTALSAVSPTTYHGMFAHVHAEGHGYFAHAGAWIQLLDTGSSIGELADVDLSVAPTTGQVLKYDGSNWIAGAASSGGGLALTDFSVSTNAASGGGALTYNNLSGVFSYTPPDLSSYAQTANLSIANWDAAHGWGNHASAGYLVATAQDKTNWNTAYGWGNHASAGYLTSAPVTSVNAETGIVSLGIQDMNDFSLRYTQGASAGTAVYQAGVYSTTCGGAKWSVPASNRICLQRYDAGNFDRQSLWTTIIGNPTGYAVELRNGTTGGAGSLIIYAQITSAVSDGNGGIIITHDGSYGPFLEGDDPPGTGNFSGYVYFDFIGSVPTQLADGDILQYVSTDSLFKPTSLSINSLSDVDTSTVAPTDGQALVWDNAAGKWEPGTISGGGNTSVTISDTAPGSASAGDLWWESDTGRLKIYYQDTDTIQWVDTNPALRQDRIASTGAPATASSTGTPGDIRYDSSYVYICIANNTWKRAALATW